MDCPLISVTLLTYNQEQYIAQSIESILSQERDFPIEVIINDDHSDDNTGAIIKQYQNEYPDVITSIVQPKNRGAMNCYYYVQSLCRGKYRMGSAGDDYWLPGRMKLQYDYMESHPEVGMCYGKARRLYGERLGKSFGDEGGESIAEIIRRNPIPAISACRRSDLQTEYFRKVCPKNKGWLMEDLPMWLWFCKNSKIRFLDEEMGVYRVIQGSISHPTTLEKRIDYIESWKNVVTYYAGNDSRLKRIIEKKYEHSLANAYLREGDYQRYRKHNKLAGGFGEQVKNCISYLPYGKQYLLSRLAD